MMRFLSLLVCLFLAIGCGKPDVEKTAEPVAQPDFHTVNFYVRMYDSQPLEDAEKQYVPALEKVLRGHSREIRIEAITNADGETESLGIDLEIRAAEGQSEMLKEQVMEALRIAGAPYATQIYEVNAGE